MTLDELRIKRADKWNEMENFLKEHTNPETGCLSIEDDATYTSMENELNMLTNEIKRNERKDLINMELNKPTTEPIVNTPVNAVEPEKQGTASKEYGKAFSNFARSRHLNGDILNALQIGTDSEGGYLCPDEFEHRLIQAIANRNVIRKYATVVKTGSGERKIPVVSSHGSANWTAEEASISDSDEAFTQVTLGAHKAATLIKVSNELLNDSAFDLEAYLANEFGRRIGALEETAFATGDGSSKPTGLVSGGTAAVTTASASAITCDELIDLFYALKDEYRKNAVWLMNGATIKAIRKLKDGTGNYIWQQSLVAGAPDTLLGRPIVECSAMPTIASNAKTVVFGDLSYYWIADRTGISFQKLTELYAANDQTGFKGTERVDGKVVLAEAIQVLKMHS